MIDYTKYEGHTPGPWGHNYDDGDIYESGGEWRLIGSLENVNDHGNAFPCDDSESCANARLIADAPALLARCKALEAAIRAYLYHDPEDGRSLTELLTALQDALESEADDES